MNPKNELLSMFDEFITEEDNKSSKLLMKLSNQIIKCRLKMNKTQKEFAEFLGISQSMVSKIESEQYNFTIEMLVKIFYKLGLELDISFKNINNQGNLSMHSNYSHKNIYHTVHEDSILYSNKDKKK